jgi:hypothetical protein
MSIYNSATSLRGSSAMPANNATLESAVPTKKEVSSSNAVSEKTDPSTISANPKEEWDQTLQQARKDLALKDVDAEEVIQEKHQRSDVEALANRLRYQIEQTRAHHSGLMQMAGEVESTQFRQITSLMSMIASLSSSLNHSQAKDLPDYQQISGFMRSLEGKLSLQRQQQSSDRSRAEVSLYSMQNEQVALERELAMIHQQLSALHSRLISLGAP